METNKEKKSITPKVVTPKEETVTLPKSKMDEILSRLNKLESIQDKSRLAKYDAEHKGQELTRVKVSSIKVGKELKLVTGWETVVDEMYQDSNGVWHEKQIVKLYFSDGMSAEMSLVDSVRQIKKVDAEVLSRSKDAKSGDETLKVALVDGGQQLDIDVRFVN